MVLRVASCFFNSFLTTSFRSHARENDLLDFNKEADGGDGSEKLNYDLDGKFDQRFAVKESSLNSPNSSKSFGESQLELFHHRQGLLVLHFVAALMFVPSFAAWLQVYILGATLVFSYVTTETFDSPRSIYCNQEQKT